MSRFWLGANLGFDLNPGPSLTTVMDLGLLGCCHLSRGLMDQHSKRSHSNKAVDVVVCELSISVFAVDSGQLFPVFCQQAVGDRPLVFAILNSFLLGGYAAAAIGADATVRNGSYTSPLTHNR